uniref:Si:ch211-207b24.4 n=1 Tax=Danio rerio TaxID=7955 RepID=A0A0R4IGE1_DANRE|nr:neoverrucotoxin subunit alpha-like isoform X1 [Danio rerio]|eukprot:XP_001335854.3 neoverrucotoxin subunit alpha-like isoform X1 [Danio rerio]
MSSWLPLLQTDMASDSITVAALGRPLFPGMLYDCRKDSFIPGVTLWDKKSLREDLDSHSQLQTDLNFSSSDSLSSKSNLLDVSASLKASFLGGLVEVGGSAKFLHDTKSSHHQSRVTMQYSETTRFDQLTMTHLGKITYPQVFEQKTATHVVTAVLYGAQAFMVFDRTFSEEENKEKIDGELNLMVKKIPKFSIEGSGAVHMTDDDTQKIEKITCTFYGDFHLEQSPTSYMEALDLYKKLPSLLMENTENGVPIKVWLYPLHLLDSNAAQLEAKISTGLVSDIGCVMEELGEVERTYNDLSRNTLVNNFSNIKERLYLFHKTFNIYKAELLKDVGRILPAIRGGKMKEISLEEILIHRDFPGMFKQWLNDAKSEFNLLSFYIKGIKTEDSDNLNTILLDPNIDFVVCLTLTSLNEDLYLQSLREFLKSDKSKELDGKQKRVSVTSATKWFNDSAIIIKMRENLSLFRSFSEANKDENRICFLISATSNTLSPGSSIYLYEKGKLKSTEFQPVSKPPPLIVKNVHEQTVSLKLQKSPTGETVQYRVEYKQVKAESEAEEQWLVIYTTDEDFTLTGLESGKPYMIRYRIVSRVGVSEASETVNPIPMSSQPVIVGLLQDSETTFMTPSITTIKKISVHGYQHFFVMPKRDLADKNVRFELFSRLEGITVFFNTGHMIKVGRTSSITEEFIFDDNDKLIAATMWQDQENRYFGGFKFEVANSDGTVKTYSAKCTDLSEPVKIDVKSGKCYGVTARCGKRGLQAFGFYFI